MAQSARGQKNRIGTLRDPGSRKEYLLYRGNLGLTVMVGTNEWS